MFVTASRRRFLATTVRSLRRGGREWGDRRTRRTRGGSAMERRAVARSDGPGRQIEGHRSARDALR